MFDLCRKPMRVFLCVVSIAMLSACGRAWNDPYPLAERGENILYSAFTNRPKHLDPVQSYAEDEATFLYQIYEPPLQYHYLNRPYELIPGAAAQMPRISRFDADGQPLPEAAPNAQVAHSVYEVRVRKASSISRMRRLRRGAMVPPRMCRCLPTCWTRRKACAIFRSPVRAS